MEEKKIVFKSIEEQLAEEEKRTVPERRPDDTSVKKAATQPKRGRKKLRLKKSVRRTIGSLMLATSLVVAAVPVGGVSADSAGSTVTAPELSAIDAATAKVAKSSETTVNNIDKDDCIGGFPLLQQSRHRMIHPCHLCLPYQQVRQHLLQRRPLG